MINELYILYSYSIYLYALIVKTYIKHKEKMSKNQKTNPKQDLNQTQTKKYFNERKLEEIERRVLEDKIRIERLVNENKSLQEEIKSNESEAAKLIVAYNMKIEDLEKNVKSFELQNDKYKLNIEKIKDEMSQSYMEELNRMRNENESKINSISNELGVEKERVNEYRKKKTEYKEMYNNIKNERDRLNETLLSTIKKYDDYIRTQKQEYDEEIIKLKEKEDAYLKEREVLSENEVYEIYKEMKGKLEKSINDIKEFKEVNSKISEENKVYRLSIDTNDEILKECAKIQIVRQRTINQLKEELESKTKEYRKIKLELEDRIKDMKENYDKVISNLTKENQDLKYKNESFSKENKQLKRLGQYILDQRNDVEIFFLEAIEDVKKEIYIKKKRDEKKNLLFPSLTRKYMIADEEKDQKKLNWNNVSIKELSPEDKEKVIRVLFKKVNENRSDKHNHKDLYEEILRRV